MVEYVHGILHVALRDAMRWSRVSRNVADAATPPPKAATRAPHVEPWTADQLHRFLDFVADSRYLPAWVFFATAGCRRGEGLGLGWKDVNLDAGTAAISRQVSVIDHRIVIKPLPKTKRGHVIRLDSATIDMLRRWKAHQNQEKLLAGPGYEDQDFVFGMPDGNPYLPDRFSREFVRKQQQYNRAHPDNPLPRLVLHDLRHTWATLALAEGIDIKIVSERLNHSSSHVTREIYTHVTPPNAERRGGTGHWENLRLGWGSPMISAFSKNPVARLCRMNEAKEDVEPVLFASSVDGFREDPHLHWLGGPSEWVDPADLARNGVLVVLGEPGIGKSTLIRQLVQEGAVEWIDGGGASSTKIAEHIGAFAQVIQEHSESSSRLVVDQLDECADLGHLPRLIRGADGPITHGSGAGLILGCRATDWSTSLHLAIEKKFGTCQLVELAPLSREEAIRLASSAGVDGARLVDSAVELGAGFLAGVPLTLEMLVRIWMKRGKLSGTARELFAEATLLLAEEPADGRMRPATTAPSQIVAVAQRIATHLLLTGRRSIWTGRQLEAEPFDLPILSLAGGFESTDVGTFNVEPQNLEDTIASGIFTANGPHRVRFKHSSLAAFLCASYFREREMPASQLRLLLLNAAPDGTHGVPASLRETAAWLAALNPNESDWLARADPESLSSHSRLVDSAPLRRILVDSLLDQALEVELGDRWWRRSELHLDHPGLVDQLTPVLRSAITDGPSDWKADARLKLALRIARKSDDLGLLEVLLEFAGCDEWPCHLRAWAAAAASSISLDSAASALTDLLQRLDDLPDEDDELRGVLLRSLVPGALTHLEAMPYLTPRKNRNLIGSYRSFLADFAEDISDDDAEALLVWVVAASKHATSQGETAAWQPSATNGRLADAVHVPVPEEVLRAVPEVALRSSHGERLSHTIADLLVTRMLEIYEVELPPALAALPHEPEFDRSTSLRRGLIVDCVRVLAARGEHAASIVHGWRGDRSLADIRQQTNRRSSLVDSDDLHWLIKTADALSEDETDVAQELADLAAYVFDRTDSSQIQTVLTNQIGPVWARLSSWFDAVPINGEVADRERHYKRLEREQPWSGRSDFVRKLEKATEVAHGDEIEKFWNVIWNLQFDPSTGRSQLFPGELLTDFPAFRELSSHHQRLFLESTRQYATTAHDHRASWLGTDEYDKRSAAGYWCLAYLLSENDHVSFPCSTLESWAGAIFWYPTIGHNENEISYRDDLLRQLEAVAPAQLADTIRKHCRGNLRRGESCWELRSLEATDSEPILDALRELAQEIVTAVQRLSRGELNDDAIDPNRVLEIGETEAPNAIGVLEDLLTKIADADEEFVVSMLTAIAMAPHEDHDAHGAMRVAAAAKLVLDHATQRWPTVSDLLRPDPDFGRAVARRCATHRPARGFNAVPAATIASIYEWMSSLYPSQEDAFANGFVSPDQQAQDLQRGLLNELARRADGESLDAVQALCSSLPDSIEVRATLVRTRANSRAASWRGPSHADLHKMLESESRRLVRNDEELLGVVVEALHKVAADLATHGEFLWDRHRLDGPNVWEPKYESSLSLYIAHELRLRLADRATVVNREVVVRHTHPKGAGERTDILVQASSIDSDDQPAALVIEVKGQWNTGLLTSLVSQLVDRYLPAVQSRAGIYLVGWFPIADWSHKSDRRKAAARLEQSVVEESLAEQARSCQNSTVEAMIVDIPRPRSAARNRQPDN